MTKSHVNLKNRTKFKADYVNLASSLSILCIAIFASIGLSPEISRYVKRGLSLCYSTIIPAVFPFMILSDLMLSLMHFEKINFFRKVFTKLFKINGYAMTAFICGLICGFPVAVKVSNELYMQGKITKNECERLIGFSNNASPAFVISGIGYGLRGSLKDGLILYFVSVISSVIIGVIFSMKEEASEGKAFENNFNFSLTDSVRNASYNTLNICGFITLFSVILGLLRIFIKNDLLFLFISPLLEIGNASKLISTYPHITAEVSLSLTAFAVTFSGFSVHFQSKSILNKSGISMKKYYIQKLLSGILAALICLAA